MISRLQGRFLKQFSFDMNYRWAKSIDTTSFESPCSCTNQSFPVDQREERGPSDFDVKHSFTMSGIWDLPFFKNQTTTVGKILGGWQISGITTIHTGFPWTPKLFGCLDGATMGSASFCDPRPIFYYGSSRLPIRMIISSNRAEFSPAAVLLISVVHLIAAILLKTDRVSGEMFSEVRNTPLWICLLSNGSVWEIGVSWVKMRELMSDSISSIFSIL